MELTTHYSEWNLPKEWLGWDHLRGKEVTLTLSRRDLVWLTAQGRITEVTSAGKLTVIIEPEEAEVLELGEPTPGQTEHITEPVTDRLAPVAWRP